MKRGWNQERGAFVQHYGSDVLDASVLLMPLMLFIAPRDPRWLSTLEAIGDELVSDSLVYRYNVEASPDGLRGDEGTFSMCSFWYVEALTRAGRLDEARLAFEKMLTYANHLGLYAEEIGPTGEQLGNFPQAFTHLALISAAYNLNRASGDTADMRVIECNECGETISAANDDELQAHLTSHLRSEHGQEPETDEVADLVHEQAYDAMDS